MGIRNYSGSGRVPQEKRVEHKHVINTYSYKFSKTAIGEMWGASGGLAIGTMLDLYKVAKINTENSLLSNPSSASFSDLGWSGMFSGSLTGSIDATHTKSPVGAALMGCFGGFNDTQFPRTYLAPVGLAVQGGRGWFSGSLNGFFSGSFKGSYPDNFETSSGTVFEKEAVTLGDNETNHFTGSFKLLWSGSLKTLPGVGAPGSGSVVGNYMTGSFTIINSNFDIDGFGQLNAGGHHSPSAEVQFDRKKEYFKHFRTGGILEKKVKKGKTQKEVVVKAKKTVQSKKWTKAGVTKGGHRKKGK
jgi:hypothetical protein